MSELGNLRLKNCACCSIRLDKSKRSHVRRINDNDLLNKLNTVKPIILSNKRKVSDMT